MPDPNAQQVTIEACYAPMSAALEDLKNGAGDRASAVVRVDREISEACRIPSMTWRDGTHKSAMMRVAFMGVNTAVARKALDSLSRDLEDRPPRRSVEH